MAKYVLKRIALMLITFFIIITICFVLIKLLPDPIISSPNTDKYAIEVARREALGYYKPLPEQYFIFLKNIFQGNFGVSFRMYFNQEVVDIIKTKLPHTILINLYAFIFSIPLGIALGILAALKKNHWQDHLISITVILFVSVPSYVYAFLVQYYLSFKWQLLPLQYASGTNFFTWGMFSSAILPVLALSFGTIAGLTRYTRAELTEVLTSDFMLLAKTKGLSQRQATVRHALRNSMVPILPLIISEFVAILSGSLIIEKIFAIPGIGDLFISSIAVRDYNIFMALLMFYTFIGLAAGIIVDLSYGMIDPRIRIGGRK